MSLEIKGQNTVRNLAEGGGGVLRQLRGGEVGVGHVHPRYYEASRRLGRFYAASQSAVTTTVALNTTYTGLLIYNPVSSPVDLVVDKVSWAYSVAPVAIATVGLFTGFSAAGIATHTTPLTSVANCYAGGPAGFGKADAAATLVGTPQWVLQMIGGFTAGALFAGPRSDTDVEGAIVLPPGGYCGIGTLTAGVGFGSIMWEEVLRQPS